MDEITPYLAFTALVWTLTDWLNAVAVRYFVTEVPGYVKQLTAWSAGVVVTLLASVTNFAVGIPTFSGQSLASASLGDVLFVGLTVGATAGVGVKLKRAIDNGDSDIKAA